MSARWLAVLSIVVLGVVLGLAAPPAPAQPITVDGDLSDWTAPQGDKPDPCNEILAQCKSGFDFTRLVVYYDWITDRLYFGIDVMDVTDGPCSGLPGPGVPGDADGNEDPSTKGDVPCEIGSDQDCVGPDEQYVIKIDTNFDLDFTGSEDLRVVFRGNRPILENGLGQEIQGGPVTAMLGQAGRSAGATRCEDDPVHGVYYNPATEDIEFVVENYSQLDPVPVCFEVDMFAGSLVDGPPEDFLDEPILIDTISDPALDVVKRVRNVTEGGDFDDVGVAARPGDTLEFEVQVCNTGNIFLDPVILEDVLPPDYIEPAESEDQCQFNGNTLHCDLGRLEIGDCVIVHYQAKLSPDTQETIVKNTAVATSVSPEEGQGVCGGQPVEASDPARVVVLRIDCDKQVSVDGGATYGDGADAVPGQEVYFKVIVSNDSMVDLDPVTLEDVLPGEYENPEIVEGNCTLPGGNTVQCELGPIPAESTAQVIYRAAIRMDADPGVSPKNTATILAQYQTVSVSTSCFAIVDILRPGVACTKEVSLDGVTYSPSVGAVNCQDVWFKVTVSNTGEPGADLFDLTLADVLPGDFVDPVIVQGAGCDPPSGNTITCSFPGPLSPGDPPIEVIYKAEFRRTTAGTVDNQADVTAVPGVGPTPAEQGGAIATSCDASVNTLLAGVICERQVSLTQGNYATSVNAVKGQTVFFRVGIQNSGTAPLAGATVTDALDTSCFENVQPVSTNCSANGNTISCDILGPIPPGGTASVVYKATVKAEDGTCTGTADVTAVPGIEGNEGCPVPTSCDATVEVLLALLECDKNVSLDGVSFSNLVPAQEGDTVWFEVLVSIPDGGEACMLNVALADTLPSNYDPSSIQIVEGASCGVSGGTVSCSDLQPAPLCPGDPPLRVVYKATLQTAAPDEQIVNTASVTGTPGIPGVSGNDGTPVATECSATVVALNVSLDCVKTADLEGGVVDGQKVTFTVTITNTSQSDVTFDRISLSDQLTAGFKEIEVLEPQGVCDVDQQARSVDCNDLGPLAKDQGLDVRIRATLDGPPGPIVANAASATGEVDLDDDGTPEIVKSTNCDVTIPVLTPCITCVKEVTLSPDNTGWGPSVQALPGQRVFFRVRAINCATDDVSLRVTLDDTLPPVLTDIQVEEGSCGPPQGGVLHCDLGEIPKDGEGVVRFSGKIPGEQPAGSLVNTATVTGEPGPVENPGKPVTSSPCSATVNVPNVEFVCTKKIALDGAPFGDSVEAVPGQKVLYKVTVQNTGDVDLEMTLVDDLPPVLEGVVAGDASCGASSGNTVECNFPLAAQATKTIEYSASVASGSPEGTYLNTVDLTGDPGGPAGNEGDPKTKAGACSASLVVRVPAVSCVKGVSDDGVNYVPSLQVLPGAHVYFRVEVSNDGHGDLRNLHLSDLLPADCYENVVVTSPACPPSGNAIECDLGDLAEGATPIEVLYEADVLVLPSEQCPNTARITAETGTTANPGDPVETDCSALVVTVFLEIPTLSGVGLLVLVALLGAVLLLRRRHP